MMTFPENKEKEPAGWHFIPFFIYGASIGDPDTF